ncbi:MAG: hypothetical protein K2W82_03065 [Candidatus Obscuribacterales bacterium]|nr:hypothetical protein [Candidatus Obscuribacterales bacterium]
MSKTSAEATDLRLTQNPEKKDVSPEKNDEESSLQPSFEDWRKFTNLPRLESTTDLHELNIDNPARTFAANDNPFTANVADKPAKVGDARSTATQLDAGAKPGKLEIVDSSRTLGTDFTPKSSITRDATSKKISDIYYPDGSHRHIDRDAEGKLTGVVTSRADGSGTTSIFKKGEQWFIKTPGMELPYDGEIKDEDNGDICFRSAGERNWRREHPDGTIATDKLQSDGSILTVNAQNKVERVVRTDGTVLQQQEGGISETRPGEKPLFWKQEGDSSRRNFHINDEGATVFETADGTTHTINRRGLEVLASSDRAKITLDSLDRLKTRESKDGKSHIQYEYFGNTKEIQSLAITDKETNKTETYTRKSADSLSWQVGSGGFWNGQVRANNDGSHMTREVKADRWNRLVRPQADAPWSMQSAKGESGDTVISPDEIATDSKPIQFTVAQTEQAYTAPAKFDLKLSGDDKTSLMFDPVLSEQATKRDQTGNINFIDYGNGKTRQLITDAKNEVSEIRTTIPGEGTNVLVKKGEQWFVRTKDQDVLYPGKIEPERNGDICFQTTSDGTWRRERPGGSIVMEKTNEVGARLCFDSQNKVQHVTRKNGSTVEQLDANTIVESKPGQKPITWTKQAATWMPDSKLEKPRTDFAIHQNGDISYLAPSGTKYIDTAASGRIIDAPGKPTRHYDDQHRLTDLNPQGQKRHYEFFDGPTADVRQVVITNEESGNVKTMTRSDKSSWEWDVVDTNGKKTKWHGEIRIASDGVHSYREVSRDRYGKIVAHKEGDRWTSHHADDKVTSDTIGPDGSRTSYDAKDQVVSFRRPDGFSLDKSPDGNSITINDPKADQPTVWTRDIANNWTTAGNDKDVRRDLSIDKQGNLAFLSQNGDKHFLRPDLSRHVIKIDGTKIELNKDMQVLSAQRGENLRTFLYNKDGQIQTVKDINFNTRQEKFVFDRKPKGEETRTHIHASEHGDFSYANPDGTAVIERSNQVRVDLDQAGDIIRASTAKGSRRFHYEGEGENKKLAVVIDTRRMENGTDRTDMWTRVRSTDGTFTNEFRSITKEGKARPSRFNLTPTVDGEYDYRRLTDKPGDKPHVSRLRGEGFEDGVPESVEDAHLELVSNLEGKMEKGRIERMEVMMKQFEKRMKDQVELMVAGGINPEAAAKEAEISIAETYYHCNRLLTGDQSNTRNYNPMYNFKTRVDLAENLVCMAAQPQRTIVQGSTGTCWWESSWNVGVFQRNANHGARFVTDIALTRQYTSTAPTLNSKTGRCKTLTVPPEYVQITRGRENSGYGWHPGMVGQNSKRSPVGMIMDQCGPPLYGARSFGRSNAGWHDEAKNIIYMMTGKNEVNHGSGRVGDRERIELLATGGWTSSGGGHMWGYSMRKDKDGSWLVIRDDQYSGNDRVIERIRNLNQWAAPARSAVRQTWKRNLPEEKRLKQTRA